MPEITIENFSCIKSAQIKLRRLNIIIGPQGSGKSVTTKLIYFFSDILLDSIQYAEDGVSLANYKKVLQKRFNLWFPPTAWGDKKFFLNFVDQKHTIRVMRRVSGGSLADDVNIKLSKEFEDSYEFALSLFERAKEAQLGEPDDGTASLARNLLEESWRTRDESMNYMRRAMGDGLVTIQTFIPAGRAFFTSIGRLVAGIEHAGSLDPATLRFAKIFANWRDRLDSFSPRFIETSDYKSVRLRMMAELFEGVVQSKRDLEYIEMNDGRRVPFSSLSSGQQELLPLWYFMDNMMLMDAFRSSRAKTSRRTAPPSKDGQLVYIEEPEAHLFPAAQSKLFDSLIEVVIGGDTGRNLIITTHSPYIMTRLNVLLKAGQLGRRRTRAKEVSEVVDRAIWLNGSDVLALSIEEGIVKSIMDDNMGLVDASFLDSISETNAEDFERLLELEHSN